MSEQSDNEIGQLEKRLQHAVKEHDVPTLHTMVADDFRVTSYSGHPWGVVPKDKWIDYACRIRWTTEFEFQDILVHRFSDTAVVISHMKQNGSFEGRDVSGRWLAIDLWRLEEKEWKILSRHAIPAN